LGKTVQKIPFLRLVTALTAGILTGTFVLVNEYLLYVFLFSGTGLLIWLNFRYSYQTSIAFGLVLHLVIAVAGYLLFQNYNRKPIFYENGLFSATVLEMIQEKQNSYQSVLHVNAYLRNDSVFKTDEKVMVYFAKTEHTSKLEPGSAILFKQSPQLVKNNNNPFEFDYKSYLARKKIHRQVYLSEDTWIKTGTNKIYSLICFAERLRMHLLSIYRKQNLGEEEFQVLSALTLGYKRGLDPETKRVFASAGAMHVLAVSGLHVGIIYLVLAFFLKYLKKHPGGRIFFVVIMTSALWIFAFITGLSPSVSRAATMFTFVVTGEAINRRPGIYNSLAASAFLLLLINPNNLFEPGFQLSYCAVFGIVFLQPKLEKLVSVKNRIILFFWRLLTVSLAAQIATFPVSVFYFNQFPVYFWISNLLVIPAVTILIPAGLGLLAFSWVPFVPGLIAIFLGNFLKGLIYFLEFIEKLPASVVEFSFSGLELAFVGAVLISTLLFIETKRAGYFIYMLVFLWLCFSTSLANNFKRIRQNEIIVYNIPNHTVLHLVAGKKNYVISEENLPETGVEMNTIRNTVRKLRIENPVFLTCEDSLKDSYLYLKNGLIQFENKTIAFQPSLNKIPSLIEPDIILHSSYSLNAENPVSPNQVIVSKRVFGNNPSQSVSNVYSLQEFGAFRQKF
jgi:competence protein ComEC